MKNFINILQVPWLMKATSDDENPTPGYMFKEICGKNSDAFK